LTFLAAALVLMVGGPIWFYALRSPAKPLLPPMKVFPFTSLAGAELDPAFSPDGKEIAFNWTGEKDDNFDIYVKQIDSQSLLRLTTHPAVDLCPVWSPDGAYIAFSRLSRLSVTDGGIYIVRAKGGAERKVYSAKWDDPSLAHIDWSPEGKLLAFQDRSSPQEPYSIFLLSLETLEKRKLTSPPEGHWNGDWNPAFSPDGKMLAFMRDSSVDTEDIYLVPVGGGEARRLTFDNTPLRGMAWTPDGSAIVFTNSSGGTNFRLWKVSISGGTPEPLVAGGEEAMSIAISRQGNRLAYTQASPGNTDIWRIELSSSTGRGSSPVKLIGSSRGEENPKYSPDGKKIAFASDRSGSVEIWVCDNDGSNQVKLTNFGGPLGGSPNWSPDGRRIAFDSRPEGYSQIFVINADGGQPHRITKDNVDDTAPSWSKDGKWIYFSSVRGGAEALQTWKIPSQSGEAVQVTKRGGFRHSESTDGKFFYYDIENAGVCSVWKTPIEGGQESKVIEIGPQEADNWTVPYNWTVTAQGVYFVNVETKPFPSIEFFSFASGIVTQVASVEKDLGLGIDVSPDGRWLLYSQIEGKWSSDIMLVENFR
jgi:Tol biopolymer transport system component